MSRRFNSNLYLNCAIRYQDHELRAIYLPNDYLWARGRYPTKIRPCDLPDWYVSGYLFKRQGYLSAKGIVDIVYRPDYFVENHSHKYDSLFVSFHDKITRTFDERGFDRFDGYDYAMSGYIGYQLIEKMKIYSPDINTDEIVRELILKEKWYVMRKDGGPLVITEETPVRVFRSWMSKPWILGLEFNDSSFESIDMRALARKMPKVAEHLDYFQEKRIAQTDLYGYGVAFDCGLRLTAAECYEFCKG